MGSIWGVQSNPGQRARPALAPLPVQAQDCCARMPLLAQDQYLATEVRRMQVAEIAVHARLRGGELDGHLGCGLDDFFNAPIGDFETMGIIQLIDEGEFHLISLLHHDARW
jgi:hypothetical protein